MGKKDKKYIKFLGLEMERNYWVLTLIGVAMAIIGFLMAVIGASPVWFPTVGSAVGIIGAIGTWLTVLTGATKRTIRDEHSLTRKVLDQHTKLLKEIRDSLRKK